MDVRQLTLEDLDWAVAVLARRRAALVPYAPVYWRPALGAAQVHHAHLRHVITDAGGLGFRTDDALLIAVPGRRDWTIDDAAVPDGGWDSVGRRLWAACASQVEGDAVRFVCPVPETDRLHFAVRLGLEVVESWWHLELPLAAGWAAARDPGVAGATAVRPGAARLRPGWARALSTPGIGPRSCARLSAAHRRSAGISVGRGQPDEP